MSKVIVTGGCGFIASHIVDRLIDLGHSVLVIDNLSTGKIENLNKKADFIKYDISELEYFPINPDYVLHLAAIPGVPYSVAHPSVTHKVNVDGTYNILKASRKAKVKKVVFASTCALYDENSLDITFNEKSAINPKTPYGLHKLIGEQYMKLFNDIYDVPTVCLRLFNVYGKRSDPNSEYSLVISKFKKLKEEGRPLTIYGNGEQTRDFVYVEDVADAFIKAMESFVEGEIINICSGKSISINRLVDLIGGEKIYLPERQGDADCIEGDNQKAKRLLNWIPRVSIEEGLKLF